MKPVKMVYQVRSHALNACNKVGVFIHGFANEVGIHVEDRVSDQVWVQVWNRVRIQLGEPK